MIKDGLVALNGIPGTGKTLDAVTIAINHFKKMNSPFRKTYAYLKYRVVTNKVYKFVDDKVFSKINCIYFKIFQYFKKRLPLLKLFRLLIVFLKIFLKLFMFLMFWTGSLSFKMNCVIVYFLYKFIKSSNKIDYLYYQKFPHGKINNVYSSFPILLDKDLGIWSNCITLACLTGDYSFLPDSLIIIDEVQLFVDSDEYDSKESKPFITKLGKFLQAHRHFGVKEIIVTSQNPSRIFKKMRNIVVWYVKQEKIIKIPFTSFAIMKGIAYSNFDDYGKYIPKNKEERNKLPFDYKKLIQVFNYKKSYDRYDSTYLSSYIESKPLLNLGRWTNFKLPKHYLDYMFEGKKVLTGDQPKKEHRSFGRLFPDVVNEETE